MDTEQAKSLIEKVIQGRLGSIEERVNTQKEYLKSISASLDEICQAVGVKFSKIPGKPK